MVALKALESMAKQLGWGNYGAAKEWPADYDTEMEDYQAQERAAAEKFDEILADIMSKRKDPEDGEVF